MTPDQLGYALLIALHVGPAVVVARWVRRGW
jgi:hypothetical protein